MLLIGIPPLLNITMADMIFLCQFFDSNISFEISFHNFQLEFCGIYFFPDIEITPFIRLSFLSNKRGSLHLVHDGDDFCHSLFSFRGFLGKGFPLGKWGWVNRVKNRT